VQKLLVNNLTTVHCEKFNSASDLLYVDHLSRLLVDFLQNWIHCELQKLKLITNQHLWQRQVSDKCEALQEQ